MYQDLIERWGRFRRLNDEDTPLAVEDWRRALDVRQSVRLQRISPYQVTDTARGRRGCSLVGVVYDTEQACIYHTRTLVVEDILHELLHVAHPTWPEHAVAAETERVLRQGALSGPTPCAS